MAETFPWPIKADTLRVVSGITFGRDAGGLGLTGRKTEPYWAGTLTTPALSIADRKQALSDLNYWLDMNKRISFVHGLYHYPEGYDATTWPLTADAVITEVTDRRTIKVSGLEVDMVLPRGTRFTVMQGALRCYRSLPTAVTVTSALSQALPVSMRLPMGVFEAGATVRFAEPEVLLAIVPDSWDGAEDIDLLPLSFDVSETLK